MSGAKVSKDILLQRKAKKKQKGLRRLKTAVLMLLCIAALALTVRAWLSPVFSIKQITVDGNSRIATAKLLKECGVRRGDLLTLVSGADVNSALRKSDSWVGSVKIVKNWPSALLIAIGERKPTVRAKLDSGMVLVDGGGSLMYGALEKEDYLLPVLMLPAGSKPRRGCFEGPESVNALKGLEELSPALRGRVKYIRASSVAGLHFQLKDGPRLYYGEAVNCGAKNLIAKKILDEAERNGRRLEYLDVRVPSRPASKLRTAM